MRIHYDDWIKEFKTSPIVKVDGQLIRNVSMADDVANVVEFVKGRKLETIRGNVEIIGELRK